MLPCIVPVSIPLFRDGLNLLAIVNVSTNYGHYLLASWLSSDIVLTLDWISFFSPFYHVAAGGGNFETNSTEYLRRRSADHHPHILQFHSEGLFAPSAGWMRKMREIEESNTLALFDWFSIFPHFQPPSLVPFSSSQHPYMQLYGTLHWL